jgi:LPXTG-site transpeptidase (sortase) family protein
MNKEGLSNKQFVVITLVIVMCGIAIIGHDYFLAKRAKAYEDMSIVLSQEPEQVERVEGEPDTSTIVTNNSSNNGNNTTTPRDPSGRVKKTTYTYNYAGRLKIPSISLNRGFVKYGTSGNNVNQNIAIMKGFQYPNINGSNFIIAAHNGSGWNAFFTNIDKLKLGSMAYVTYNGKEYSYVLKKIYSDPKRDGKVTIHRINNKKQLTLITCKRPDYVRYYLVLVFELTEEKYI